MPDSPAMATATWPATEYRIFAALKSERQSRTPMNANANAMLERGVCSGITKSPPIADNGISLVYMQ